MVYPKMEKQFFINLHTTIYNFADLTNASYMVTKDSPVLKPTGTLHVITKYPIQTKPIQ